MPRRSVSPTGTVNSLMKMTPLSSYVQDHLVDVYRTLGTGVGSAACGAALQMMTGAYATGFLGALATMMSLMYFLSEQPLSPKRKIAFHVFSFLQGFTTGPLLSVVAEIDSMLPFIALAASASIFACLSVAAIFSKRREYIYFGGFLGSAVTALFWVSLLNAFIRNAWILSMQLYAGLLVFCGFVLYDSQVIIEKAEIGDKDTVQHAFDLFVDLLAIFRHVLVLLAQNSASKRKRDRDDNSD